MSNHFFNFKKFKIDQQNCAMKVGTDGVLLGSWCNVNDINRVLDIGTGTGLISLMIAQRNSNVIIDSIEIDEKTFIQAKINIENSPWKERINVINISFQEFNTSYKYDLIVSNPPFFENSVKNNCDRRSLARHTDSLPFETLIENSVPFLNPNGILAIIYPYLSDDKITSLANNNNLQVFRKTIVKGNAESNPIRILAEFKLINSNASDIIIPETLIIEHSRHNYTKDYITLTKDFYLKM